MPRRSETHDAEMIGWKRYAEVVHGPVDSSLWIAVTHEDLPVAAAYDWSILPSCGAVVLFSGTMRNHADGRDEVKPTKNKRLFVCAPLPRKHKNPGLALVE